MKKLIFILCGLMGVNAVASDITNGPLQQHPALCNYGYNPNCNQNSSSIPPKIIRHITVNVPSKYGALAQDKNGVIRGSSNENSLAEAKKSALTQCNDGKKNQQCTILVTVRNGCYAAAAGRKKNNWFTYGIGGEIGQAENKAMKYCESKYSDCRIVVPETCSIP